MKDFKKQNRFSRGPSSGGFRSGGRPDFGGPKEMHKAVCSKCSKTCEVPFRPNGKKPIFCSDCFVKDDSRPSRDTFAPRGNFHERSFDKPRTSFVREDRGTDDLKKQIEGLNRKLDILISLVESSMRASLKDTLNEALQSDKKPAKKSTKRTTSSKKK